MSEYFRFKLDRKSKYHLVTEFDLKNKIVKKTPYNHKAEDFYQKVIVHNQDFRRRGIPCVSQEGENLNFAWTSGQEISEFISTPENLSLKIEELKQFIIRNFETYHASNFEFTLFNAQLENFDFDREVLFAKNCDVDLILQNFIWVKQDMLILDLEWGVSSIPVDFLLWRSLIHLSKVVDVTQLLSTSFTQDLTSAFAKIEMSFQKEVCNTSQLAKFQYGKLENLSSVLKDGRNQGDHQLYMFETVVEENIKLRSLL